MTPGFNHQHRREFAKAYAAHRILAQSKQLSTLFLRKFEECRFYNVLQPSYMPRVFMNNLHECYLIPDDSNHADYLPSMFSLFDLLGILFRNAPSLRVLAMERGDFEWEFREWSYKVRPFGSKIPITRLEIHFRGHPPTLTNMFSKTVLLHWMPEAPDLKEVYFVGTHPGPIDPRDHLIDTMTSLADALGGGDLIPEEEGIGRTVRRFAFLHSSCDRTKNWQRKRFLQDFYHQLYATELEIQISLNGFSKLEILDISAPLLEILPMTSLLKGDSLRELRIHCSSIFNDSSNNTSDDSSDDSCNESCDESCQQILAMIKRDFWPGMGVLGGARLERVLLNDMTLKDQILRDLVASNNYIGVKLPKFEHVPDEVLLRELKC